MSRPAFYCPCCQIRLVGNSRQSCSRCDYELIFNQSAWRNAALPLPTGFSQERRDHLSRIEKRHFWFEPRDRLLHLLVQREMLLKGDAIELGCGSGRLLKVWDDSFDSVTAVESYSCSLDEAASLGSQATLIQADVCNLPFDNKQFDTLLAFDVLEHVLADDMLSEARRVARDGAKLLLSVPAYQSLWSYADEMAGHRYRYNLKKIEYELQRQQWRLLGHTYYQCTLFPLLWLSRRVFREHGRTIERAPFPVVARILGVINAVEVALGANFSLPFGSSLIVWAEAI